MALPLNLGNVLSTLGTGAHNLAYAAQTFLPNHPQTRGFILSAMEPPDAPPTDPYSSASTPDFGGPRMPGEFGGIVDGIGDAIGGAVNAANTAGETAQAAGEWFDLQRIGFLVLGIIFIGVGVVFIARQTGDIDLDNRLKRAQLTLAEKAVQKESGPGLFAKLKREPKPKPIRDHASDPRPDFGAPIIEQTSKRNVLPPKRTAAERRAADPIGKGFGRK